METVQRGFNRYGLFNQEFVLIRTIADWKRYEAKSSDYVDAWIPEDVTTMEFPFLVNSFLFYTQKRIKHIRLTLDDAKAMVERLEEAQG